MTTHSMTQLEDAVLANPSDESARLHFAAALKSAGRHGAARAVATDPDAAFRVAVLGVGIRAQLKLQEVTEAAAAILLADTADVGELVGKLLDKIGETTDAMGAIVDAARA